MHNVETKNDRPINMTTMMTFQEDGPGALLETASTSIEQTKNWKVYVVNIKIFLKFQVVLVIKL